MFYSLILSCVINLCQRKNSFNQGRRRMNGRAFRAQREESIRRTVYVSDIDQHVSHLNNVVSFNLWNAVFLLFQRSGVDGILIFFSIQVTEERLAALFTSCGQVTCMLVQQWFTVFSLLNADFFFILGNENKKVGGQLCIYIFVSLLFVWTLKNK